MDFDVPPLEQIRFTTLGETSPLEFNVFERRFCWLFFRSPLEIALDASTLGDDALLLEMTPLQLNALFLLL